MITVTGLQQDMMAAEKRRRHREREREQDAPGVTAAHVAARAELDASDGEHASKATGAEPGPGTFREPVTPPEPQDYRRGYLDSGHAAPSPQAGPPNIPPLPPGPRGVVLPAHLDAIGVAGTGPGVAGIAAHQAQAGGFCHATPPAGMGERGTR